MGTELIMKEELELPLPSLFEQAQKIHNAATESNVDQDVVRKGCEILDKCEHMIDRIGLFSSNETKEDISTNNLKYLLVPFYLAELTEKLVPDDDDDDDDNQQTDNVVHDDRIRLLKFSQAKLKEFISFCEAMELVPKEELEALARGSSVPPAERRALKIARFRRQRTAESQLLEIKERKERRRRSTKASALSTPVEAGEEDLHEDDGEEEREAWLTTISLAICKAFDLLEMLKKEEEMLSAVKERQQKEGQKEFFKAVLDDRRKKSETWHRDAAARAPYAKPTQPITCATLGQDILEGRAQLSDAHEHKHQPLIFGPQSLIGGSVTSERERIAAQVFQPGHRLPTMSIEEAGLKEMEIMNKWQETNVKLMEEANYAWYKEDNRIGPPKEEDEDDDDDAATEKARRFDDWKDENPRGADDWLGLVAPIVSTTSLKFFKLWALDLIMGHVSVLATHHHAPNS
ncbi:hypothetical protein ACFE04_009361 [Oxalis oulophora]